MSATKARVALDKGQTRSERVSAAHAAKAERAVEYMKRRAAQRGGSK